MQAWVVGGALLLGQFEESTVVPSERRQEMVWVSFEEFGVGTQVPMRVCAVLPQPVVGVHAE